VAYAAVTRDVFWIAANLAGLCLGASQSAGRALVGYLSPAPRRAERGSPAAESVARL
jgi:MFS transporter, UMF1 family